ncbi:hypothetical protein [Okeania sp. SIO2B3]|uniref:hypothetical protein n=1 Tax=Okeania sp. SIO2B3 TaxID=2607784 RepID=UPI0025F00D22|nr:hypothetical protein [Okeania sp. SIO2B3]
MKSNSTNWQSIGIGIVGLAILGVIAWFLFSEISKAPWPFIAILVAALGALITVTSNLNIQIRNEQIPKKVEVYDKVINFFFDSIFAKKMNGNEKTPEELAKEIYDMTPDLILWASDDVLNLYIKLKQISRSDTENSSDNPIKLFSSMLLAMRKDLGHQNNQLNEKNILGIFVIDIENLPE